MHPATLPINPSVSHQSSNIDCMIHQPNIKPLHQTEIWRGRKFNIATGKNVTSNHFFLKDSSSAPNWSACQGYTMCVLMTFYQLHHDWPECDHQDRLHSMLAMTCQVRTEPVVRIFNIVIAIIIIFNMSLYDLIRLSWHQSTTICHCHVLSWPLTIPPSQPGWWPLTSRKSWVGHTGEQGGTCAFFGRDTNVKQMWYKWPFCKHFWKQFSGHDANILHKSTLASSRPTLPYPCQQVRESVISLFKNSHPN